MSQKLQHDTQSLPRWIALLILPFVLLDRLAAWVVIGMIAVYQKTFSPDHGMMRFLFPHGACRFHPTCSMYGRDAMKKYGFVRGTPKMLWRILRCNPWSRGGIDTIEVETRS